MEDEGSCISEHILFCPRVYRKVVSCSPCDRSKLDKVCLHGVEVDWCTDCVLGKEAKYKVEWIANNFPLNHPTHVMDECCAKHDHSEVHKHGTRLRSTQRSKEERGSIRERNNGNGVQKEDYPRRVVLKLGDLEGNNGDTND